VAASEEFLGKAREALEADDLVQASEKAWGATAQMVKALAESRGWPHGGHRQLVEAARLLAQETGERRIFELFQVAGGLHVNFSEQWLSRESVETSMEAVHDFIEQLRPLVDGSG
jgi:hypothetical protein